MKIIIIKTVFDFIIQLVLPFFFKFIAFALLSFQFTQDFNFEFPRTNKTMSDSKEESQKTIAPKLNDVTVPPPAPTAPPAADLENQTEPAPMGTNRGTRTGFGVPGILRRWKRDDLMKRSSIILTALAFVFSLLAFIIMASNKHGDWKDFDNYEEYK